MDNPLEVRFRELLIPKTNYANITRESIELYKSLCAKCQQKRKRPTRKE